MNEILPPYLQVFLVRKISGKDKGTLYAMKVLKKATLKGKTRNIVSYILYTLNAGANKLLPHHSIFQFTVYFHHCTHNTKHFFKYKENNYNISMTEEVQHKAKCLYNIAPPYTIQYTEYKTIQYSYNVAKQSVTLIVECHAMGNTN